MLSFYLFLGLVCCYQGACQSAFNRLPEECLGFCFVWLCFRFLRLNFTTLFQKKKKKKLSLGKARVLSALVACLSSWVELLHYCSGCWKEAGTVTNFSQRNTPTSWIEYWWGWWPLGFSDCLSRQIDSMSELGGVWPETHILSLLHPV